MYFNASLKLHFFTHVSLSHKLAYPTALDCEVEYAIGKNSYLSSFPKTIKHLSFIMILSKF